MANERAHQDRETLVEKSCSWDLAHAVKINAYQNIAGAEGFNKVSAIGDILNSNSFL